MWFDETLASGMVPYHHIIGGENGMGEDRRWLEPARKYFNWMARHDAHFVNKRSIANIGVVMGQRTHLFYKPPRGALMPEYMNVRANFARSASVVPEITAVSKPNNKPPNAATSAQPTR